MKGSEAQKKKDDFWKYKMCLQRRVITTDDSPLIVSERQSISSPCHLKAANTRKQFFYIFSNASFSPSCVCFFFSCSNHQPSTAHCKTRCGKLKMYTKNGVASGSWKTQNKTRTVVINECHKSQDFKWQLDFLLPFIILIATIFKLINSPNSEARKNTERKKK